MKCEVNTAVETIRHDLAVRLCKGAHCKQQALTNTMMPTSIKSMQACEVAERR